MSVLRKGTRIRMQGNVITSGGIRVMGLTEPLLDMLVGRLRGKAYSSIVRNSSYSEVTIEATLEHDKIADGPRIDFVNAAREAWGSGALGAFFAINPLLAPFTIANARVDVISQPAVVNQPGTQPPPGQVPTTIPRPNLNGGNSDDGGLYPSVFPLSNTTLFLAGGLLVAILIIRG